PARTRPTSALARASATRQPTAAPSSSPDSTARTTISGPLSQGARGLLAHHGADPLFQPHALALARRLQAACYQGKRGGSQQAPPPGVIDDRSGGVGQGAQDKTVGDRGEQDHTVIERDPGPDSETS